MLKATIWSALSPYLNVHPHSPYNHRAHELLLENFIIVEGNETINMQAVC